MNRVWRIAAFLVALAALQPALSQAGGNQGALSPGEEPESAAPAGGQTQTPPASNAPAGAESGTAPASSVAPVLWKNPDSSVIYATSTVKFVLSARDNISDLDYIEYRLNNGEFRRYSAPFTLGEQGPYTITYRSVDRAGNREVDHIYSVIVDDSGPTILMLPARAFIAQGGRSFSPSGNTFTLRASDEYSGVKQIRYSINSTELKPYNNGETVQLTQSGSHLIQWEAVDNLGNRSQGSLLVQVDADRPTLDIRPTQALNRVDDRQYARRNTGFRVEATDVGSGIQTILVRLDGSPEWQTYTDAIFFDSEREHSIEAKAIDAVGNESDVRSLRFIVDDNPPTTELRTSVE
ncbi:MAG: hypothetical protein K1X75_03135 [Leptospirales bacterium]|nr:hypothetical protein [Leptospirales bacterium]